MKNHNRRGFTLIELSIVMVIIGLIIGGILTGQELIHGAQVRATITQIVKYNTAVTTFQSKYNSLPGDMPNAMTFIVGALVNGDGNGLIGGAPGPATPVTEGPPPPLGFAQSAEYQNFWAHLSAVGLIEGSFAMRSSMVLPIVVGTDIPPTKVDSNAGISVGGNTTDSLNYFYLGPHSLVYNDGLVFNSINFLSPSDALVIDTKMDDGNPIAGIVAARGTSGFEDFPTISGDVLNASGPNFCLWGEVYGVAPNGYNTSAPTSAGLCQLRIRLN